MDTQIVFNGGLGFLDAVRQADADARAACAQALVPVEQQLCPVRAGEPADGTDVHMRDAIGTLDAEGNPAAVAVDKPYALFVALGTTKMPARNFPMWAVDAQRAHDIDRMSQVVPQALARVGVPK